MSIQAKEVQCIICNRSIDNLEEGSSTRTTGHANDIKNPLMIHKNKKYKLWNQIPNISRAQSSQCTSRWYQNSPNTNNLKMWFFENVFFENVVF